MEQQKNTRCFECKRQDIELRDANEYEFLAALDMIKDKYLLCRICAILVYFDLTGVNVYVLPVQHEASLKFSRGFTKATDEASTSLKSLY